MARPPDQAPLRRAVVVWLKPVLLPARVPNAEIPNVIELQEMRDMLAERVKTWTEEWKRQGLQEGIEEGIKQGIQQGVHRGEAKVLRRQLTRRFGPLPAWVDQHLERASLSEFETWAERVLDGQSLEGVLGHQ